jgi:GR25 family glycosyltransferase involved in LPS biosynthesis
MKHEQLKLILCILVILLCITVVVYIISKNKPKKLYDYNIYVINLARRRDRMVKFSANYDLENPYEIIDAVDGQTLNFETLQKNKQIGDICVKSLKNVASGKSRKYHYEIGSLGAIGCSFSHINIWKRCANEAKNTIVYEDDAHVSGITLDEIDKRVKSLPDDWHIYLLGKPHTVYETKPVIGYNKLTKVKRFCGLHAYVISQKGANWLIKNGKLLPIQQQIDSHLSELAIDHDLNIYIHPDDKMYHGGDNTTDIQVFDKGPISSERLKIKTEII